MSVSYYNNSTRHSVKISYYKVIIVHSKAMLFFSLTLEKKRLQVINFYLELVWFHSQCYCGLSRLGVVKRWNWRRSADQLFIKMMAITQNLKFITLIYNVVNSRLWSPFWWLTDQRINSNFVGLRRLAKTYLKRKKFFIYLLSSSNFIQIHPFICYFQQDFAWWPSIFVMILIMKIECESQEKKLG